MGEWGVKLEVVKGVFEAKARVRGLVGVVEKVLVAVSITHCY